MLTVLHMQLPTVYELSDSDSEVSESKKNTTLARTTPRKATPRPFSTRRTPTQKRSGPSVNNTVRSRCDLGMPAVLMRSEPGRRTGSNRVSGTGDVFEVSPDKTTRRPRRHLTQ